MTRGRHPQDQRQTPSYPGARHPSPPQQTHSPEQTASPGTRGRHPKDERQTPPRADTFPRVNIPPPLGADIPLGADPPAQCMLGYRQQAGSTHPTGMHTFYVVKLGMPILPILSYL